MTLVDYHCHLDLYPNCEDAFIQQDEARITTLTMTTTPRAWKRNRELARDSQFIRTALGLHPQLVADGIDEFDIWKTHLGEAQFVGEVGLDARPQFIKSLGRQMEVLVKIFTECALVGGRIISIHSIRSTGHVLDLAEAHIPNGSCTLILHWFSGTNREFARASDLGCYFSVNSKMLTNSRMRRLIAQIPPNRLLTETDKPFGVSTNRNEPTHEIRTLYSELASIRKVSEARLTSQISANVIELESLPHH